MKSFFQKMQKKGAVETFFFFFWVILARLHSFLAVFIFRLRGYELTLNIELGKDVYIFESKKGAIKIKENSHIGSGVRIKAGFNGKITIGKGVLLDDYTFVSAQENIEIGDETMVASHVYIVDFNHTYPLSKSKKYIGEEKGYTRSGVKIGKFVWIGTHAVILPGVTIGDNAVVGAGAVVTKDVPANSVAAGNPAKVIRRIKK